MPRYTLSQRDSSALIAYLRQLSVDNDTGVDENDIHFAMVITPDADATRAEAMNTVVSRIPEQQKQ